MFMPIINVAYSVGNPVDPSLVCYRITWDCKQWYEYKLNGYHARRVEFILDCSKSNLKQAAYIKKNCISWRKLEEEN